LNGGGNDGYQCNVLTIPLPGRQAFVSGFAIPSPHWTFLFFLCDYYAITCLLFGTRYLIFPPGPHRSEHRRTLGHSWAILLYYTMVRLGSNLLSYRLAGLADIRSRWLWTTVFAASHIASRYYFFSCFVHQYRGQWAPFVKDLRLCAGTSRFTISTSSTT
jgi:hypothetical protein